jgi:hypothetical protein
VVTKGQVPGAVRPPEDELRGGREARLVPAGRAEQQQDPVSFGHPHSSDAGLPGDPADTEHGRVQAQELLDGPRISAGSFASDAVSAGSFASRQKIEPITF